MDLSTLANKALFQLKKSSPTLLTVTASVGVLATAYFTARGTIKAAEAIHDHETEHGVPDEPRERAKRHVQVAWRHYVPAATTAAATVACIVGSHRVGIRRAAAAQAGLFLAERTYAEYRAKVVDEFGQRKDDTIREGIAKDRVKQADPHAQALIISGPGMILSMELYTGRQFLSDMETLRRAQNTLNDRLLKHDYATLEDFYHLIGLSNTSSSSEIGWKSNRLMELDFTTTLSSDGRPCLAFDYNYTNDTLRKVERMRKKITIPVGALLAAIIAFFVYAYLRDEE